MVATESAMDKIGTLARILELEAKPNPSMAIDAARAYLLSDMFLSNDRRTDGEQVADLLKRAKVPHEMVLNLARDLLLSEYMDPDKQFSFFLRSRISFVFAVLTEASADKYPFQTENAGLRCLDTMAGTQEIFLKVAGNQKQSDDKTSRDLLDMARGMSIHLNLHA